ncbi:uncharacterized protein LOC111343054 [Stylophora pistillata]|uniref:uncharacterized protein LOC111343054 n=1 Tax=Stylophora pistillata TaxID=50429 RepID=UPI000C04C9FC|nr:uncharacterized protein LOC111343054 [Stylophora pistillata]
MTTEHEHQQEEARNLSRSDNDDEIHVILKITPVLTFSSGPENESSTTNSEVQNPASLEKKHSQSGHSHKQTNWFSIDKKFGKSELQKERVRNFKLEGLASDTEMSRLPQNSPAGGRGYKMFLRSLSQSSAAETKESSPSQRRRLSDPTIPGKKNLKKNFEGQGSLKKLRPKLKRKAVSPLHLFSKATASNTCFKHIGSNHDAVQNKETKVGPRKDARLAKRLYPSFSKAYEHLAQRERRGSDPTGVPIKEEEDGLVNDYETMINDFSNQIQDLAFNLENLTTSDAKSNFVLSGRHIKANRLRGDSDGKENSTGDFFKPDDFHLQGILEEVLRSHLLTMDDYSPTSCDRASRSISKIITRLCGSSDGEKQTSGCGQRKIACLVYIGAVRDGGIQMAAQALWTPDEDTFAAASFRNDSLCGLAVVITTPNF